MRRVDDDQGVQSSFIRQSYVERGKAGGSERGWGESIFTELHGREKAHG